MVLLAEDEETVRGLSAKVLRGQGYTVLEALRVAEQLDEDRIDLLLTDIVVPVMGGRELADRLRASQGASKVLYTSGYSDGAVFSQQRLETGTEFISKPFTPESLAQRVRETPDML
jgi:CheY-like chemotaxis protein